MNRFVLSRAAGRDLDAIFRFVARDSVSRAESLLEDIYTAIYLVGESPGIGHTRPEFAEPDLRCWPVYTYLIIYRCEGELAWIVRVLHGARDLRAALRGSPSDSA